MPEDKGVDTSVFRSMVRDMSQDAQSAQAEIEQRRTNRIAAGEAGLNQKTAELHLGMDVDKLHKDILGWNMMPDVLKAKLAQGISTEVDLLKERAKLGDVNAQKILSQVEAKLTQDKKSSPVSLSWQEEQK